MGSWLHRALIMAWALLNALLPFVTCAFLFGPCNHNHFYVFKCLFNKYDSTKCNIMGLIYGKPYWQNLLRDDQDYILGSNAFVILLNLYWIWNIPLMLLIYVLFPLHLHGDALCVPIDLVCGDVRRTALPESSEMCWLM